MPTHQLLFGFSPWGFEGLHTPREDGIPRLKPAGFHCLEAQIAALMQDAFVARCKDEGLLLVAQCYPLTAEEIKPTLKRARDIGVVQVNAHAGTAHLTYEEAVSLLNGLYDEADAAGVRLLVETHRGRLTQDLFRTSPLCAAVPRLRVTLDVSHYVVCEERPGPTADLKPLLDPILDRAEMIHGRISNGEQIQVDVGDGQGEMAQLYVRFWAEAMRRWRLRAKPGSSLIFTPELGPPDYAIRDTTGREFSNRWEQSLVIRSMAEQAWKLAGAASGPLW